MYVLPKKKEFVLIGLRFSTGRHFFYSQINQPKASAFITVREVHTDQIDHNSFVMVQICLEQNKWKILN